MNGIVWDGGTPEGVLTWVERHVGSGRCQYSWQGVKRGWHVTVMTVNGDEVLRPGDAVIQTGNDQLGVVRAACLPPVEDPVRFHLL